MTIEKREGGTEDEQMIENGRDLLQNCLASVDNSQSREKAKRC